MLKKYKKVIFIISAILIILQGAIFFYFRETLVPGFDILTWPIKVMSIVLLPIYILLGIFHLVILLELLKCIPSQTKNPFLLSLGVVLVTVSGITLLSDITILSDIGKEYLYFSVTNEWYMLFGFTLFHFLSLLYIYLISRRLEVEGIKFTDAIHSGNDQMFLSLYQIVGISGFVGFIVTTLFLFNVVDFLTYQSYLTGLLLMLSALVLLPVFLFISYWVIKFRKIAVETWFDELQSRLTVQGISWAMLFGLLTGALGIFLSIIGVTVNLVYWLLMMFFIELTIISVLVILKTRVK